MNDVEEERKAIVAQFEKETQVNLSWADVVHQIQEISPVYVQQYREKLQQRQQDINSCVEEWKELKKDDIKLEIAHVENLCDVTRRAAARTESVMKLRMAEMEVLSLTLSCIKQLNIFQMNKSHAQAFNLSSRGYDQQLLQLSSIKHVLVAVHSPRLEQLQLELIQAQEQ